MRIELLVLLSLPLLAGVAAEWKENDQGVLGYDDTEVLPWTQYRKHDSNRPAPAHIEAVPLLWAAPVDAEVLFDGTGLEAWVNSGWTIRDGLLIAGEDDLVSKAVFGDAHYHVEFRIPDRESEEIGNRGNSGLFPMSRYEIQVFDSHPMHRVQLYPDGQCASVYGETPPLYNACRKPGEWQSMDILFTAPVFEGDTLVSPAKVTVFHNGILVHHNQEIRGPTTHRDIWLYRPHRSEEPFKIQGHGCAVEFRNIWVRRM